ncbi:MAG: hypothetical protein KVP17_003200 [Porospora cf. gigantea B]|uniref:uncharacterized protein n=1 Tax=Porospora cf. gigantea B TaxID=2853592 RepID=UPI003571B8CF|nr:MAG: hypothetical protein KVP17_003200 [Porospora cf. gigantea B]
MLLPSHSLDQELVGTQLGTGNCTVLRTSRCTLLVPKGLPVPSSIQKIAEKIDADIMHLELEEARLQWLVSGEPVGGSSVETSLQASVGAPRIIRLFPVADIELLPEIRLVWSSVGTRVTCRTGSQWGVALLISDNLAFFQDLTPIQVQFEFDDYLQLALDVSIALQAIHASGFVHSDVTLHQISVVEDSGKRTYHLLPHRHVDEPLSQSGDMWNLGYCLGSLISSSSDEPIEIMCSKVASCLIQAPHESPGSMLSRLTCELLSSNPEERPDAETTVHRLRAIRLVSQGSQEPESLFDTNDIPHEPADAPLVLSTDSMEVVVHEEMPESLDSAILSVSFMTSDGEPNTPPKLRWNVFRGLRKRFNT